MVFSAKFVPASKSVFSLLEHTVTPTQKILMGGIVTASYQAVQNFLRVEAPDFLMTPRAKKLIPEYKNMAVEYALARACDQNVIPFSYDFGEVPQNKGLFLQLHSRNGQVVITVNQTRTRHSISRDAKFRMALFDEYDSRLILFDDEEVYKGATYLELNHGYQSQSPKFAVLGKPCENGYLQGISLPTGLSVSSGGERRDIKTTAKQMAAFSPEEFRRLKQDSKG